VKTEYIPPFDLAGTNEDDTAMPFDITGLAIPMVGGDREGVSMLVESLRGRTAAATFARTLHAATTVEQVGRYRLLAERGVKTVFVALPDRGRSRACWTRSPISGSGRNTPISRGPTSKGTATRASRSSSSMAPSNWRR